MANLSIVVVLIVIAFAGLAEPLRYHDGDIAPAGRDRWDNVARLGAYYGNADIPQGDTWARAPSTAFSPVSPSGRRFFEQSEVKFSTSTNNNGMIKRQQGGIGTINDNGIISHYNPRGL